MANTIGAETIVDTDFEREQAELLKRAEEKPTLRMINAKEARPIEEWKRLYQEQALFIEVTKEDFSKVYEGKLIATAESSIEFIDLDKEYDRYDAEMVRLRKIAEEKPTLRIVNSIEIKPIKEWEELYPELWLLIEVTREDVHQIYEGKLIATAENSIEFMEIKNDLRRKGIINLTTRGVFPGPQPIVVPTFIVLDANNHPLTA